MTAAFFGFVLASTAALFAVPFLSTAAEERNASLALALTGFMIEELSARATSDVLAATFAIFVVPSFRFLASLHRLFVHADAAASVVAEHLIAMALLLTMRTHALAQFTVETLISRAATFWHTDIALTSTEMVVEALISFAFVNFWAFASTFMAVPFLSASTAVFRDAL